MADVKLFAPKLLAEEGGFVNDPQDSGGATNKGITLDVWKEFGYDKNGDGVIDVEDLKIIDDNDFIMILKKQYWDKYWKADLINNQSIAEILVDWCYNSGIWGVKIPQQILGTTADGNVGPATLALVNSDKIVDVDKNPNLTEQETLFNKIKTARQDFYKRIIDKSVNEYLKEHPDATDHDLLKFSQKKFEKGWMARINSFEFKK